MDFNIDDFVTRIREVLYDNFPFENEEINKLKHSNRLGHIRDVAFKNNETQIPNPDMRVFDIGNNFSEEKYPYYHILQDSEVIHIRGKGTKKSKGSQEKITNAQARDYGRVEWNGKTYTKEYARNVRGARSRSGKARKYVVDSNGVVYKINETSNTYVNIHYKYIDRILDSTIGIIAREYGLTPKRKQLTSLEDEYNMQTQEENDILSILDSFNMED